MRSAEMHALRREGLQSVMLPDPDAIAECRQGSVECVTLLSPESDFCVPRIKVRGQRDPVTIIGSAAPIAPDETIECTGPRPTWDAGCN